MNEQIPIELQDFEFPDMTNNQINIWKLKDELNDTRRWIRENAVNEESEEEQEQDPLSPTCLHEKTYTDRWGYKRCNKCKKTVA